MSSSKHYILYSHTGSGNHGCEALVRSTTKLLTQGKISEGKNKVTLSSRFPEEDIRYGINDLCNVIETNAKKAPPKNSISFLIAYINLKVKKDFYPMDILAALNAASVKKGDIALSIGGDVYCYGGTSLLAEVNKFWKKCGLKTVYWGCSIEPELLKDEEIKKDIQSFDLITARESISYNALKSINPNTLLVVDSAFLLDATYKEIPQKFGNADFVGINLSPLAESCESNKGITKENYITLIDYIISKTNMNVLLIPHVIWNWDDDRTVLNELYIKYKDTNRVMFVEDCNCCELKGYISRCRFFIGARTHATIAAYSSYVPTLVLGYSVKSRGIAKDIFGDYHNYVIPVQTLANNSDLMNGFLWLQNHENEIRNHLKEFMPEYISRTEIALEALKKL